LCGNLVQRLDVSALGITTSLLPLCDACAAEVERDEQERERQRAVEAAQIPALMCGWTLASHPEPAHVARVTPWLKRYVQGERRNLFLHGRVGRGKIGLAVALLRAAIEEHDGRGLFVNFRELLWDLRRSYGTGVVSAAVERAQRTPLLVLDDLGGERPTDHARDELAVLVERRHGRNLPTVVTSNYDLARLAQRLGHDDPVVGERIVSRLAGGAEVLRIDGPDRRFPS
jgi:DNA replication protein DnaC